VLGAAAVVESRIDAIKIHEIPVSTDKYPTTDIVVFSVYSPKDLNFSTPPGRAGTDPGELV
jgi:hypothetical protein